MGGGGLDGGTPRDDPGAAPSTSGLERRSLTMAHDVFVSYSSRDTTTALAVVNALESNGVRCWIAPRDVRAGDVWAQALVDAIGSARILIVVFSSHSNRS